MTNANHSNLFDSLNSTSELVERLIDSSKDTSAYDFHSSDYDSDQPAAPSGTVKKVKRTARKSQGPLVDMSTLRKEPEGSRRYNNHERSVIFMAMAAARARIGADMDDLGGNVFRETCKVLDEYHHKYPLSCSIAPRTLYTIWNFFKKNGHTYASNIDGYWSYSGRRGR